MSSHNLAQEAYDVAHNARGQPSDTLATLHLLHAQVLATLALVQQVKSLREDLRDLMPPDKTPPD